MQNFAVKIVPFRLDKLQKNSPKVKEDMAKSMQKAWLNNANYDRESNNLRNVLSQSIIKLAWFFSQFIHQIVSHLRLSTY